MIKKVKVDQLKPGMFIHDLNCGWMDHPFLGNSLRINDEHIVSKIACYGIKDVYIDTDKGLDSAEAPTEEEVHNEINSEISRVVESCIVGRDDVPIKEELIRAKNIKKDAVQLAQNIMEDIRLGKNLEKEKVDHVVERMIESIFRNNNALISLGRIRKVDQYTYMHSVNVCVLMVAFGRHLGFERPLLKNIGIGALLHDIGKIKIPPEILNKPDQLSDEEYIIARAHVVHSRIILEQNPDIHETSLLTAAQHHERWDGTGYPDQLKGEEISIFGQMSAIVDVYDAITSCRCYKDEMQPTEALRKLYEWSTFYFNRPMMEHFIRCIGIYPVGTLVSLASGWIGVVIKHIGENMLRPIVRVI